MKKKLLISFSGGETSAFMLNWILNNWNKKYDIKIIFANTGEENEETLVFINKCAKLFNCTVVWVEGVFHKEKGKGTTHKVVDFKTATRSNILFEEMIKVYGIPNKAYPHCNRELKLAPIKSYLRSIGWKKYYTAIGIRYDELDRMNGNKEKNRLLYPLITELRATKPKINLFWSKQNFRLQLKGYQGNCKTCWKKSDNKLRKLASEDINKFNSFKILENKYSNYVPEGRKYNGQKITFFRGNKTAQWFIDNPMHQILNDDSNNTNIQQDLFDNEDSCDIFSNCKEN